MIVTTTRGARRLRTQRVPRSVQIRAPGRGQAIPPHAILRAVGRASGLILLEGGPRLFGDFFAQRILDEQFLTLAPQFSGRDTPSARPGLATGRTFAPRDPRWGPLVDLRRAGATSSSAMRSGERRPGSPAAADRARDESLGRRS